MTFVSKIFGPLILAAMPVLFTAQFAQSEKFCGLNNEFTKTLSFLGHITPIEASRYCESNSAFIDQTYTRFFTNNEILGVHLSPKQMAFSVIAYLAERNMERIYYAHEVNDLELVSDVPDYFLLVGLKAALMMQQEKVSQEEIDYNFRYWKEVLSIAMDQDTPNYTYSNRLDELIEKIK